MIKREITAFGKSSKALEKVYDTDGLHLLLRKTKNSSVSALWFFRGELPTKSGKRIRPVKQIGTFPEMDLTNARNAARAQVAASNGKAALSAREPHAKALTFREWFALYLANPKYSGAFQGSRRKKLIGYGENYLNAGRKLPDDVRPLGSIILRKITHEQIQSIIDVPISRRNIDCAKLLSIVLKSIFAEACAANLTEVDLAKNIAVVDRGKFEDRRQIPRERFGEQEDLARFLRALEQLPPSTEKHAILLLNLVALRPGGELLGGKWSEIDWDKRRWIVDKSRVKKKNDIIVPLSSQALVILRSQQVIAKDSPFLFPSKTKPGTKMHSATVRDLCKRLSENRQSLHGFRGLFATFLLEELVAHRRNGLPSIKIIKEAIALQLDHQRRSKEVKFKYDQTKYLSTRAKLMQIWADMLDNIKTS
jgi:integrase